MCRRRLLLPLLVFGSAVVEQLAECHKDPHYATDNSTIEQLAECHKEPHYAAGRSTMVHLFEWKWNDIAAECERFLGPHGFGGVQISPPNENLVLWSARRPWWERYQPISYRLRTRSGDQLQLTAMLRRCNNAGVRVYADAVVNHMSGTWAERVGSAGSRANFSASLYPAVPYNRSHFHWPRCDIRGDDYGCCAQNVRNCQLSELKDLDQGSEHVRQMIVNYMNHLIDLGVAGFRIDAAKHMWPGDLSAIYSRLHDLNTAHGFSPNARPYIYQEVIDLGGEAVRREEYTPLAAVTEFRFCRDLSAAFQGKSQLRQLANFSSSWGLLPSASALVFVDNHDNQRGHGSGGAILTYKAARQYRAAIAFMLAHPYGQPQLMSSYSFTDSDAGPPMDAQGDIISPVIHSNNTCGNGWVCEHRWHQIYQMVSFRNVALGTGLDEWWDNGSDQIAFCRGRRAFIAFNGDSWALNQTLQTCLPAGTYCDVISGARTGSVCSGRAVTVRSDGRAHIELCAHAPVSVLAIHRGEQSRL